MCLNSVCLKQPRNGIKSFAIHLVFGLAVILLESGCGGSAPPAPAQPASISAQPVNDTVLVGQSGYFSVTTTGTAPLTYQWTKNGAAITGAATATYTTPVTTEADTGSLFAVTVSNSLNAATSDQATLTVMTVPGPAPKAGDIRFRQVAAPATINGYAGHVFTNLLPRFAFFFHENYGSPLSVGRTCGPPDGDPSSCGWSFESYFLSNGVSGLGVSYQSGSYNTFNSDLAAISVGNSVVTSLDLEQGNSIYAMSWVQSDQASGFDMAVHTLLPSSFQTAASQEGAQGRVITSLSFQTGNLTYMSYGWQNDASTVYEVAVASATYDTLATVAQNLASNGYIITAVGGETADGLLMVGTRVRGNTAARPLRVLKVLSEPTYTLRSQGYAIVGLVEDPLGNLYWMGER